MNDSLQGMRQLMDSLGVLNCQSHHVMWVMRYLAQKGHSIGEYGVLIDEAYTMSCTQVTLVRTIAHMQREREIAMYAQDEVKAEVKAEAEAGQGMGGGGEGLGDYWAFRVPLSTSDPERVRAFMDALAATDQQDFESVMLTPTGLG